MADAMGERRPVRVLLVDDDRDIRAMYGARLRAAGFDVSLAANGVQALAAASGPPAIILLDVRMPGMNGIEVLRRLKESADLAAVPVVMLSNDSDPATITTCALAGAVAWWTKSALMPAELCRRIHDLLGASEALDPSPAIDASH